MNKFKKGFGIGGFEGRKHNVQKPFNNQRRQMLDMGREKYFRFDLDDLLVSFELDEYNKNTIAATILNKMTSSSMDDAFDYIERMTAAGTFTKERGEMVKGLLRRYSKWR
jgi:hypothetical protein